MQHNDADLLALLASDLDRHFGQLVLAYQHRLYAFMLRQTDTPQDAEDIVQEAFMQVYFALGRYTPQQVRLLILHPWLYKVTLNTFYARKRKSKLQSVSLNSLLEGDTSFEVEDDAAKQPEILIEEREELRELGTLVSKLPEHYRTVVNLYYFEELSYQEIAEMLNMPMGSVKSHLYRGIRGLRTALVGQQNSGK